LTVLGDCGCIATRLARPGLGGWIEYAGEKRGSRLEKGHGILNFSSRWAADSIYRSLTAADEKVTLSMVQVKG
jgi:hypothetical protein